MGKTRDSRLVGARTEGGRGGGGALPKGKEFLIGGDTVVLKLGSSDDWATWVVLNLTILATSKVNFKECELSQ